jgi:hypothetical protein
VLCCCSDWQLPLLDVETCESMSIPRGHTVLLLKYTTQLAVVPVSFNVKRWLHQAHPEAPRFEAALRQAGFEDEATLCLLTATECNDILHMPPAVSEAVVAAAASIVRPKRQKYLSFDLNLWLFNISPKMLEYESVLREYGFTDQQALLQLSSEDCEDLMEIPWGHCLLLQQHAHALSTVKKSTNNFNLKKWLESINPQLWVVELTLRKHGWEDELTLPMLTKDECVLMELESVLKSSLDLESSLVSDALIFLLVQAAHELGNRSSGVGSFDLAMWYACACD